MQTRLVKICSVLLLAFAAFVVHEHPIEHDGIDREVPSPQYLLRRASDLAAQQDEHQHYWTMRALLHIGEVQVRARDFEGARVSIRASEYAYGRNAALVRLAEELAGAGKRQESLDVLRELGFDHGWRQSSLNDGVRLRWIEHLVAAGEFKRAQEECDQLEFSGSRPEGFRKLAVAYAKSGDHSKAALHFKRTLDAIADTTGHDQAIALWETGAAQLSLGEVDAARATIRQLVADGEKMDAWAKVAALREAAVLLAKLKDRPAADSLFEQAIKAVEAVDANNKVGAIKLIAMAQARVGYIDDALKTAQMITHSKSEFSHDAYREEALFSIAQAQLKAGDSEAAIRTALSITYFLQYRDDALHAVVDELVKAGDNDRALQAAEKVHNSSRRASAMLKTATGYAKAGDRKRAVDIASRIELNSNRLFAFKPSGYQGFDYRRVSTWGENYDLGNASTGLSSHMADERTAETAMCAMTLAQALPLEPKPNYREHLDHLLSENVIWSLARAHASSGNPAEALDWAQHVGSDAKVKSEQDHESVWRLQRRIYALIGVAEGMLERTATDVVKPKR